MASRALRIWYKNMITKLSGRDYKLGGGQFSANIFWRCICIRLYVPTILAVPPLTGVMTRIVVVGLHHKNKIVGFYPE